MAAVRPRKAQAPTGSGSSTRPVMVDRKIASSDQACAAQVWRQRKRSSAHTRPHEERACIVTPTGQGMRKRITRPTDTEISAGTSLAPTCAGCEGEGKMPGGHCGANAAQPLRRCR